MKGRSFSDTSYRYGFNVKEKDKSFASTSNYDYGFRVYNPRIARFLSVDPLARDYSELSPADILYRPFILIKILENIQSNGLYNGNISYMTTDLSKIGDINNDRTKGMQGMLYRYDQLHRITKSLSLSNYDATNGFTARSTTSPYDENYSYDANGNILTLQRNDELASLKDDFNYTYYANSNKLQQYRSAGGTYQYDATGNLTTDTNEGVTISWTPYGKVRSVLKGDTLTSYRYDGSGNRIEKKTIKPTNTAITRYLRDASGNVMTIYNDTTLLEQPIYGSSRVGLYKGGVTEGYQTLGKRNFELSNHLGNVLTVITDNAGMQVDSVWATVVSANDYYPFGLEMKGRSFSDTAYRYGFNGKEKDGSFASTSDYDYGFRIYNPAIAKFLSEDPLTHKYPELTPYQFASNTPIQGVDLDGLELYFSQDGNLIGKFGNSLSVRLVSDDDVVKNIKKDVKAKLNTSEKEYSAYKTNSATIDESIRQIDETRASSTPIGIASVITNQGKVTRGATQSAFIDPNGLLTTPELLPRYAPPSDDDKDGFTVMHSHPIDAFTIGATGAFEKVLYDQKVSGLIYNSGNVNKVNPSKADTDNSSINGKTYNLILIGNIDPIKLSDVDPMQSNSGKKISAGTAGAIFYKGAFKNGFEMSEKALRKVQKKLTEQIKTSTQK